MTGERELRAVAVFGDRRLDDAGIRDAELDRARHALACLKRRVATTRRASATGTDQVFAPVPIQGATRDRIVADRSATVTDNEPRQAGTT